MISVESKNHLDEFVCSLKGSVGLSVENFVRLELEFVSSISFQRFDWILQPSANACNSLITSWPTFQINIEWDICV